jgi:SAM-dependent methyltransferase
VPRIEKSEGRHLFGSDIASYELGRPGHAAEVYDVLRERCDLGPGTKVVEVGPGTGQATHRMLELGARPLVGIEPDPALAELLRVRFGDRVEIRESTLEDADLEGGFDLATAASSFHWVDEDIGLTKLHHALRPGGWTALWWTAVGDGKRPDRPDPFRDAVKHLEEELPKGPSFAKGGRPFAHDAENRIEALERAGFDEILPLRIEWWHTWDAAGIRGLVGSYSSTLTLDPERREELLDAFADVVEQDFGGRVTRPVVTALYTARKPL